MEEINIPEKTSPIALDLYLETISKFDEINGELPQTELHGFYLWHAVTDPDFKVEGFSMLDTYRHNVLEGEMSEERFREWCDDFNLPYPLLPKVNVLTGEGKEYSTWYQSETEKRIDAYEAWAEEQGINTRPGTVMIFIDAEGNSYRVKTDADSRGEIIVA